MRIHARFRLDEVTRKKLYAPAKEPLPSGEKWELVEGAQVKLYPVQGEPFGSATPSGECMMVIANPAIVEGFLHMPLGVEFDVVFTPVEPERA